MGTSDWSSYVGSSDLVQALAEAVNQPGAIGIAAAGGIDHTGRVGRRNQQFALVGVDLRTAGAAGNDVCLDPLGNIARAKPGALLQQARLVVVAGDVGRLLDNRAQLLAVV